MVVGPPHKFRRLEYRYPAGYVHERWGLIAYTIIILFTRHDIRAIAPYFRVTGGQLACAFVCWLGDRAQVGAA